MPFDLVDRNELIQDIESALDGIVLGGGVGLHEASAIDRCVNDRDRSKARDADERMDWRAIPDSEIETRCSSLSFVDTEGMRFLLPAYMCFALRNHETSDSMSVCAAVYALDGGWATAPDFQDSLTPAQRSVIAKYLRVIVLEIGDEMMDTVIGSHAYDVFWSEYDESV